MNAMHKKGYLLYSTLQISGDGSLVLTDSANTNNTPICQLPLLSCILVLADGLAHVVVGCVGLPLDSDKHWYLEEVLVLLERAPVNFAGWLSESEHVYS